MQPSTLFTMRVAHDRRTRTNMRSKGLNQAADVDFEGIWTTLASAFREIHTKNASQLSFEQLYRNAYKLVLRKQGGDLYNRVAKFEQDWLSDHVQSGIHRLLSGSLLLNDVSQTLGGTLERNEAGKRFLAGLKEAWTDHQVSMSMLTDVLMYMVC